MNLDDLDIQAARDCLAQSSKLIAEGSESEGEECLEDANCCIQAIVLRGNVKSNPFMIDSEMELYNSFEKEKRALGLSQ
jgi:hypothetical protein